MSTKLFVVFVAVVIYLALFTRETYSTQGLIQCSTVDLEYENVTDPKLGPVVNIICSLESNCIPADVGWILGEIQIKNNISLKLEEKNLSSRFSVTDSGLKLSLRNALKEDFGSFKCIGKAAPKNSPNVVGFQKSIEIPIGLYLPSLDFPKCSIIGQKHGQPMTTKFASDSAVTFTSGSNITFTCNPGDSNPPVNLQLFLQHSNGNNVTLGSKNTSRTISYNDNNATFICYMKSDTFKTAPLRDCTFGPISVIAVPSKAPTGHSITSEEPPISSASAINEPSMLSSTTAAVKKFTSTTYLINTSHSTIKSTDGKSNDTHFDIPWTVVYAVCGTCIFIVLLTPCIVLLMRKRSRENKPNPNSNREMTDAPGTTDLDDAGDYSELRSTSPNAPLQSMDAPVANFEHEGSSVGYATVGNTCADTTGSPAMNITSHDDKSKCLTIPVYASVKKHTDNDDYSAERESSISTDKTPVYSVVNKDGDVKPTESTKAPVYASVKKDRSTESLVGCTKESQPLEMTPPVYATVK